MRNHNPRISAKGLVFNLNQKSKLAAYIHGPHRQWPTSYAVSKGNMLTVGCLKVPHLLQLVCLNSLMYGVS